jgi:hypothetical protein
MGNFEVMFGCMPRERTSLIEKGDHPEIDTTAEFAFNGITIEAQIEN